MYVCVCVYVCIMLAAISEEKHAEARTPHRFGAIKLTLYPVTIVNYNTIVVISYATGSVVENNETSVVTYDRNCIIILTTGILRVFPYQGLLSECQFSGQRSIFFSKVLDFLFKAASLDQKVVFLLQGKIRSSALMGSNHR